MAVLVIRGNCTWVDKAKTVEAAGGGLLIVFNSEESGDFVFPFLCHAIILNKIRALVLCSATLCQGTV